MLLLLKYNLFKKVNILTYSYHDINLKTHEINNKHNKQKNNKNILQKLL